MAVSTDHRQGKRKARTAFGDNENDTGNITSNNAKRARHRSPLRALSDHEFQARAQRAITDFRLPVYDRCFVSQFQSISSSITTSPPSSGRGDVAPRPAVLRRHDSANVATSAARSRPQRQNTGRASIKHYFSQVNAEEKDTPASASKARRMSGSSDAATGSEAEQLESDGSVFNLSHVLEEDDLSSNQSEDFDDGSSIETDYQEEDDPQYSRRGKGGKTANKKASFSKPAAVLPQPQAYSKRKPSQKQMKSLLKGRSAGLDQTSAPLSGIDDIFADLTRRAASLGFNKAMKHLDGRPVTVATMCSGTESPLLALQEIQDAASALGMGKLVIKHLFSAEIVPYKQAYIERNFQPPIIFRDITELIGVAQDDMPQATTAFGGKVSVPTNVDMIIAGTSCVDYSLLNNRRKGIDAGGESGDTFHAVLHYCRAFRPAIVLLENVKGADWDAMLDEYSSIGYESTGVLVDSKDFYIPHTRQRGYMACFDRKKLASAHITGIATNWTGVMDKLKRPASAPVSSFLLPNDQVARRTLWDDSQQREVDWSQCEITQMDYRLGNRLGIARPVTHWSETGSTLPPDHAFAPWFGKQVERVLDTIDGATLRKALPKNGMYDTSFKTRIWDLSQNIYRAQDTQPFGIATCVTPSGILYLSDTARPVAAEETLALQGIPLNRISFTTETPANMQDLAGNAMTSTVIGSAILAALIVGFETITNNAALQDEQDNPRSQSSKVVTRVTTVSSKFMPIPDSDAMQVNFSSLLVKARRALRRCYCEGPTGVAAKPLQRCVDCAHTSCIACGGNPSHQYEPYSEIRASPADFEDEIRALLPLRLRFEGKAAHLKQLGADSSYSAAVSMALNTTFVLQNVRRTHCWSVSYKAPTARLVLVIDDVKAEWRLFVDCAKDLAGNHPHREQLRQAVAVCCVTDFLLGDEWSWRVPQLSKKTVKISLSDSKIASWWARNGMPDFASHVVPEFLEISADDEALTEAVSGRYKYLPQCGKACFSLYKQVTATAGDAPVYLFLDPTQTGSPDKDSFVFSYNNARLEYDEVRPVIARLAASWRPWPKDEGSGTEASRSADLFVDDSWLETDEKMQLVVHASDIKISSSESSSITADSSHCSTAMAAMGCSLSRNLVSNADRDLTNAQQREAFTSANAWIFEAMKRQSLSRDWTVLDLSHTTSTECLECAPTRPAIRWGLDGDNIKLYDDHQSAALYERTIKARPDPIVLELKDDSDRLQVTLGLNIMSLAHRARARLPVGLEEVSFKWQFTTATARKTFDFERFKLSSTRDITPYVADLGMSVQLFPKQQLALAWMERQEAGVAFHLEEAEEAVLPSLGWRAEVRAQGSINVRGGVCADHPGFGKTITSLALISSHLRNMTASDIVADLATRQRGLSEGLVPTAATLIVCPQSLTSQWATEIKTKLRWASSDFIVILKAGDLLGFTIDQFRKAKIIVVNRKLLVADTYIEKLAAFAAIPGPATTSGRRAFGHWLGHATQQIPGHLRILLDKRGVVTPQGQKDLARHVTATYTANLESETFMNIVPSKRLRGAAYVAQKTKGVDKKAVASAAINTRWLAQPLFQQFYFNRIIVDEFHQHDAKESAAINALQADKRWGLSGTPAIGDFYDLARIGALLGIPLRIGSDARGIMKVKNSRELRSTMSNFELFDAMRQKPSDSMHARINEIDQIFLDIFVRQNVMDFAELKYQDHLVPVTLDLGHRLTYAELSQHLNSMDMRIKKKGNKRTYTDRQTRLNEAFQSSMSAEEALSKAAAYADEESLETLVQIREDEIQQILADLPRSIRTAQKLEAETFAGWQRGLQTRDFGDTDTNTTIGSMVRELCGTVKDTGSARKKDHNDDDVDMDSGNRPQAGGKREKTAELNQMCNRLLVAKRSLRYLQSVGTLASRKSTASVVCDSADCSDHGTVDVAVSALCGHKLCRGCYGTLKNRAVNQCPAEGCSNLMHDYHLLWTSRIGDLNESTISPYGAKIQAALELLGDISSRGDQAVLFVQFENQLEHLEVALASRQIAAEVVKKPADAGTQIADFVASAGTKKPIPVMVLNASDETAAGLNLQNANHVIFLSPLLCDSQYSYDATMAQAIGRVRRHGQKKLIHVYRIVALDTIDVDILEHRERRVDVLTELGSSIVAPAHAGRLDEHGDLMKERTQLVREAGKFSLRPQSWLLRSNDHGRAGQLERVNGRNRVAGWEDFSSLVKFSKTFTEDDD